MIRPTSTDLAKLGPRSREAVLQLAQNAAYTTRYRNGERLTIHHDGTVSGLVRARHTRAAYLTVLAEEMQTIRDATTFSRYRDALVDKADTLDDALLLSSITWAEVREWRRLLLTTPHTDA